MDARDTEGCGESRESVARRIVYRDADAAAARSTRAAVVSHAGRRSSCARHRAQREARKRHGACDYVDGARSPRAPLALVATPRQTSRKCDGASCRRIDLASPIKNAGKMLAATTKTSRRVKAVGSGIGPGCAKQTAVLFVQPSDLLSLNQSALAGGAAPDSVLFDPGIREADAVGVALAFAGAGFAINSDDNRGVAVHGDG